MGKALLLAYCYRHTKSLKLPEDLILSDIHHILKMYNEKFNLHHKDITILTDLPLRDKVLTKLYKDGRVKFNLSLEEIEHFIWKWARSLKKGSNNFFYFTGHGGNYKGKYRHILTASYSSASYLYMTKIQEYFKCIRKNVDVLTIFDCCLIGNGLQLPLILSKGNFVRVKGEKYKCRILCLTSSKKDEYSRFTAKGSIFTTFFTDCVDKNEKTKDIYICVHMRDGDDQTLVVTSTHDLGIHSFI